MSQGEKEQFSVRHQNQLTKLGFRHDLVKVLLFCCLPSLSAIKIVRMNISVASFYSKLLALQK